MHRQTMQPAALEPEPQHFDGNADGPDRAHGRLAVTQRVEVQREERVQAGVGQHGQEHPGEEPGHHRLAQHRHRTNRNGRAVGRFRHGRQAQRRGHQQHQQNHHQGREPRHADRLQREAAGHHRDHEAHRAPDPNPAVAARVERSVGADQVGQGRFADRNHRRGAHEQRHRHASHPRRVRAHQEAQRAQQRQRHGNAQQADAVVAVVGQPAPDVGAEQARAALQRGHRADRQGAKTQAAEPQRRVGAEQSRIREIRERHAAEAEQGVAL